MKPTHDITVITGKYMSQTGEEKNRYQNIGKLFVRDDGSMTVKIDCIPFVEGGWAGWASLYPVKPREQAAPKPIASTDFDDDGSIPF